MMTTNIYPADLRRRLHGLRPGDAGGDADRDLVGAIDRPDQFRRIHKGATPRMGGLGPGLRACSSGSSWSALGGYLDEWDGLPEWWTSQWPVLRRPRLIVLLIGVGRRHPGDRAPGQAAGPGAGRAGALSRRRPDRGLSTSSGWPIRLRTPRPSRSSCSGLRRTIAICRACS